MLIINFSISWAYLESSCFHFPQTPRKMTKFVLNYLFENIKLFLERASSSDPIKSSMLCFSPWTFTFKSLRCYPMSDCCDRKSRAACAQSFATWQQATIEIIRRDHSIIACSRHLHVFLFFAHIPLVVNHTINATPRERLHYVRQNSTVSLSLSFPKKAHNALVFLHIFLTSRKKNKNDFLKDQNRRKTLPLLMHLSSLCINKFV